MTQSTFIGDGRGDLYTEGKLFDLEVVQAELTNRLAKLPGYPEIEIILILGLVRSGTTALQAVLTQLPGIGSSEFQPFKNLMRQGPRKAVCLLGSPSPLLIKETLGPELEAECLMDPIGMLLAAGIPPGRIKTVFLLRDPRLVYYSCWKLSAPPVSCCYQAQSNLISLYERYQKEIALAIPFVYEMLSNGYAYVLQRLASRLGLTGGVSLVFDQDLLSSRMRWNEASERAYWEAVVAPMLSRGRFEYCDRGSPELPPAEAEFLAEQAVPDFLTWRAMAEQMFL